jgi:hypothetical protein
MGDNTGVMCSDIVCIDFNQTKTCVNQDTPTEANIFKFAKITTGSKLYSTEFNGATVNGTIGLAPPQEG